MKATLVIFALLCSIPLVISVWLLLFGILTMKREARHQEDLAKAFDIGMEYGKASFHAGRMCPLEAKGFPRPGRKHHADNIALEVRAGYCAGWEKAAYDFETATDNIMDAEELEIMLDELERHANGEPA